MIELLEGVEEDLPVAADVAAVVVALRQLLERVVDRGDHRAEELGERLLRLLGEVHEDEAIVMEELGYRPTNRYLPPRTPAAPEPRVLEDPNPAGGFLGWVDRLLSR